MEMESSRGGGGRSRPPQPGGVKKPRLMSDDDQQRRSGVPPASVKARTFPTRPSATADPRLRKVTPTAVSGLKERDSSTTTLDTSRERDRGMSSFQLRQMQELLAEYKIALAELTFNSKPIITNMTIIAGENLEAAKGIAATICANILQVPSDQKLPSLYLLDSIVKNIGRDYIKHFAARLPEVFCKAYKQVDAPIHLGMRHLFGTWKGVFPPSALQYIEKELGFSSVANGSSAGVTTSRTDSQTARPPHSIHVNPKYLDAKQLLQNANRSKAVRSDIEDIDTEKIDRSSVAGSARQWADPHAKNIHRPIRGLVNDTSNEMSEKSSSLSYGNSKKLMSDRSRFSDLKMGRNNKPVTEKAAPDNSWYEIGNRNPDLSINQRNKSDALVHGNFKAPRSSQDSDQQFPINRSAIHKRNRVTPEIWKNAEEEEYMWDDKNSKLTGHFNNDSIKASIWASDDADKGRGLRREKCIGTQWNRNEHYGQLDMTSGGEDINPYFREFEENLPQSQIQRDAHLRNQSNDFSDPLSVRGSFSGHQSSSSRPYQEPEFGHTRIGSRYSSQLEGNQVHSSSGLSTSYTPPHGSELQDFQESQPRSRANKKLAEILGESDQVISSKISAESLPSIPSNPIHHQSHSLSILQQALSQSPHDDNIISATSSPYIESWNLTPLLHSQTPVEVHPQISIESQRQSGIPYATTNSNAPEIESSGESSTSSLLASIIKSGLISKNPSSTFQHLNLQPPGPAQISDVSSVKTPLLSTESAKTLPLPPGPPLVSPATDTAKANRYPLSSLLSSLVAKGLISSKVQEPQGQTGVQKPNQFSPTTHLSNSAVHANSIPDSSSNPSSASELSLPECSEAKEIAMPQDESFSRKDLIGVEFKPEVLRSFNPVVVSSLFDDLKHQCTICGLRFQLNNKLVSHFAWHDSKSSELNQCHRKWFPELSNSTHGSVESLNVDSVEKTTDMSLDKCDDDDDAMVPADETQSICALCGEPFEDFYCLVRDEWMYKGTTYLSQPEDENETTMDLNDGALGLIVHAKCIQKR